VREEGQTIVGPADSERQIALGHVAGQLNAVALVGLRIKAKRMDAGQDWDGCGVSFKIIRKVNQNIYI